MLLPAPCEYVSPPTKCHMVGPKSTMVSGFWNERRGVLIYIMYTCSLLSPFEARSSILRPISYTSPSQSPSRGKAWEERLVSAGSARRIPLLSNVHHAFRLSVLDQERPLVPHTFVFRRLKHHKRQAQSKGKFPPSRSHMKRNSQSTSSRPRALVCVRACLHACIHKVPYHTILSAPFTPTLPRNTHHHHIKNLSSFLLEGLGTHPLKQPYDSCKNHPEPERIENFPRRQTQPSSNLYFLALFKKAAAPFFSNAFQKINKSLSPVSLLGSTTIRFLPASTGRWRGGAFSCYSDRYILNLSKS